MNTVVKVTYGDMGMTWVIPFTSGTKYPASMGFSVGGESRMYPFSHSSKTEDIPYIEKPDQVNPKDNALGDINSIGMYGSNDGQFFFTPTNNDGSSLQKSLLCDNWLQADTGPWGKLAHGVS